jgi:DNA-binding MarR family transcriptional regulator
MSGDGLAFELFNEIGIIDQLAGAVLERALPRGMTRAQFTVLNHFVRLGHSERSPAQLASAFQVTRPTMTSTLARMERAGLVAIRPDPADGRGKLVSLTDRGRTMREDCLASIAGLLPEAVAIIGEEQLPTLVEVLRKLRIALDEARNG